MKRALLLSVLLLGSGHAAAGQNLIPNGTFDTGVDGWIAPPGGSGAIEWDPVLGQPPGSLRLVGNDDVTVPELCFPTPAGTADYFWRADVYMEASDEFVLCMLNYALYDTPDCSGSFAFFVGGDSDTPPGVRTPNQWEHLNFDGKVDFRSVGYRSVRPFMSKSLDIGSDDACVLDNVHFEIVPPAPPIPTVGSVGLVLLAALTVVAGLVVLRRRSPG